MSELWTNFLSSELFIPHGHCYLWKTDLVWLHLVSDALIALAYYSIPTTLFYFVRKRQDLPFNWIFLLFSAFIVACGTTHIMAIWTLWHPTYWLSGTVKAVTATISLTTAVLLIPIVPQALALPSPAQLEQANQELQTQIAERLRVEEELRKYQNHLEELVAVRTREITKSNEQLQAARAKAETANRIKDEFLAVLSHELRTPLHAILGWSKLLQNPKFDPAKTSQALSTIERNAKLQARLIEDLLDISKILQGKLTLNITNVNLESTVLAALETISLATQTKLIQVNTVFEPMEPVVGDSTRLQQVVWNLVSNAVKFTPNGGKVEVRVGKSDDYAQIIVSDTGKGISAEFLPYAFDYFRQADSSTTRKFGGLGLGLAIVRNIVEMHGGIVKAESLGEDKGATFTVFLPLLQTVKFS